MCAPTGPLRFSSVCFEGPVSLAIGYLSGAGKATVDYYEPFSYGSENHSWELVERVARFRDSRDWRKYDTPRNLAGSICIEAAELLEHFQWKTDEQAAEMLRDPEELAEISNELADVIIYCLGFSDMLTLDVSNAVQRKLDRHADKYPSTGKDLQ